MDKAGKKIREGVATNPVTELFATDLGQYSLHALV